MKKLLLLCLPIAFLYACGPGAHKTELVFDKKTDGLHITAVKDTFNAFKETYYVTATVKNSGKDIANAFLVTAQYIEKNGDITDETTAGAGRAIAPGDSAKIETSYSFPSADRLPYKVKVSVKSTGF